MATKKLQVLTKLAPTDKEVKSTVEKYFIENPNYPTLMDKLCPAFEKSGSVVTCNPVEGYPLEVEWQKKNLSTLNEVVTFTGVVVSRFATPLPAGIYTWSYYSYECGGANAPNVVVFDESDTAFSGKGFLFSSLNNKYMTFAVSKPIYGFYLYSNGYAVESRGVTSTINRLQLEAGATATSYDPYAETPIITRCGKNLFNPAHFINAGLTENDGVYYGTTRQLKDQRYIINLEENTQHTLSFRYRETDNTPGNDLYVYLSYTDGTWDTITTKSVAGEQSVIATSQPGKTLRGINFSYAFDRAMCIKDCQLEIGNIATAYEPYNGGTFELGEQIPALAGIDNLYADTGLITVTGRADPNYTLDSILERVAALEAATVSDV